MANVVLNEPLKIDLLYKLSAWASSPKPDISNGLSLIFSDAASKIAFTGKFIPSPVTQIAGTITGIDVYSATGTESLAISDLNLDIIKSISLIRSPLQPQGLLNLIQNDVFGKADSVTGSDMADKILAYGGNDKIDGLSGDDKLYGGIGNDSLYGGDGKDILVGAAGNDVLAGNAGDDVLTGGIGKDVFVMDTISHDMVTDFQVKLDKISLVDAKLTFADLDQTVTTDGNLLITGSDPAFGIELTGVTAPLAASSFMI
ncbi:MAG: hypothetical protein RL637_1535 [Pseudomonadota bacterium]|jgi:Ca2+-binding RTX toxin-like protein